MYTHYRYNIVYTHKTLLCVCVKIQRNVVFEYIMTPWAMWLHHVLDYARNNIRRFSTNAYHFIIEAKQNSTHSFETLAISLSRSDRHTV